MANALGVNLTGRVVLLDGDVFRDRRDRRFVCTAGPGCLPAAPGHRIVGRFVAGGGNDAVELSSSCVVRVLDAQLIDSGMEA